jgi:hypothetical protein
MPDIIRTKRRYASYLLPLYVQDNSFLDFVNDELDPSGQLGSIIPEFVQTLGPLGQTVVASHATTLTSSQVLQALQQTTTATVV